MDKISGSEEQENTPQLLVYQQLVVEEKRLQPHPDWELDDLADCCFICRKEFGVLKRKHHCRKCGRVVCDACSSYKAILPAYGIELPVRVDKKCYEELLRDKRRVGGLGLANYQGDELRRSRGRRLTSSPKNKKVLYAMGSSKVFFFVKNLTCGQKWSEGPCFRCD